MQRILLLSGAGVVALVLTAAFAFGGPPASPPAPAKSIPAPAKPPVADDDDPEVDGDYGLLIVDLVEGGPAMEAGLDIDDTILSINHVRVQSLADVKKALKDVKGQIVIVFISDDTGDVEEVDVTPKNGKLGLTLEVVELEDVD